MSRMPRQDAVRAVRPVAAVALVAAVLAVALGGAGCKRSKHGRVASYLAPPLPAGFVEQMGAGWRVAVPSTWKEALQKGPAVWAVADPQAADDFHADVNIVTEPFASDSYDYARANEESLRREGRSVVEATREDVIDADPTLVIESRWAPTGAMAVGYHTMQTALASRGTGYVVTCAASSNAFERYRSTCESIVHSFAIER
jgi:hypothetical protein